MQVTETFSEGLRRAYDVVVPADEIEGKCRARLADIGKSIKLPGFRPGKVPANLLRQRYGASFMAEVMQESLSDATDTMIEERGLRPAGQPRIDLIGTPNIGSAPASDLAFKVELELLPEIATPDLAAISLVRLRAEVKAEATETMVTTLTMRLREAAPVEEDRAAESGDVLTVDFLGTIDGVAFEGGTGTDVAVEIGGSGFIPGFAEQLAGMRPGETRAIDVTFPEDYASKEVAGKAAVFEVTAKALGRYTQTAPDDSLAEKLGFESLDKLREMITTQMQAGYDQKSRLRIKRELLDVLSAKADFPAPQNLVEAEFAAIWQRVEADLKTGEVDEEDRGKDTETLKAEYRAIADRRVRLGLLLSEIGRVANIQVAQAELTQALRQEASRYPGQEMQVVEFFRKTPGAIEQLRGPLFEDKVVDYILEMAQIEDRIVSPDELNLPPAEDSARLAPQAFSPAEFAEAEAQDPETDGAEHVANADQDHGAAPEA